MAPAGDALNEELTTLNVRNEAFKAGRHGRATTLRIRPGSVLKYELSTAGFHAAGTVGGMP
jgi:hypothetical protein